MHALTLGAAVAGIQKERKKEKKAVKDFHSNEGRKCHVTQIEPRYEQELRLRHHFLLLSYCSCFKNISIYFGFCNCKMNCVVMITFERILE